MTGKKAMEMARIIEGMHGLANREDQRLFFDGNIYYYTMRYMADYYDAWVKDFNEMVWRFVYLLNESGKVTDITVETCNIENDLRAPRERSF